MPRDVVAEGVLGRLALADRTTFLARDQDLRPLEVVHTLRRKVQDAGRRHLVRAHVFLAAAHFPPELAIGTDAGPREDFGARHRIALLVAVAQVGLRDERFDDRERRDRHRSVEEHGLRFGKQRQYAAGRGVLGDALAAESEAQAVLLDRRAAVEYEGARGLDAGERLGAQDVLAPADLAALHERLVECVLPLRGGPGRSTLRFRSSGGASHQHEQNTNTAPRHTGVAQGRAHPAYRSARRSYRYPASRHIAIKAVAITRP
ncbi:MAG: hypothetical protein ACYTG6_09890, partial [Planctomycetota bacterium]